MNNSVLIRKISQKDNHTFSIEWSDGITQVFRLADLQRNCCCAGCVDETTGERRVDPCSVKDDVRADKLVSIGRYALRVVFTSGCSSGIYSFDMLRKIGQKWPAYCCA
jgi:DUF971 family protein